MSDTHTKPMSLLERELTFWIVQSIVAGIGLGNGALVSIAICWRTRAVPVKKLQCKNRTGFHRILAWQDVR